jgi:hypothetical protein
MCRGFCQCHADVASTQSVSSTLFAALLSQSLTSLAGLVAKFPKHVLLLWGLYARLP